MNAFRERLVIALSGGGVRGVMSARFLARLEAALGVPLVERVDLWVGTSAGAILAAGGACGVPAAEILDTFIEAAPIVFRRSLRSRLWPIAARFLYDNTSLSEMLSNATNNRLMGQIKPQQLVMTVWDAIEGRPRYIKSHDANDRYIPVATAALASSTVPGFFPVGSAGWVDGGLGGVNNPVFVAAVEAVRVLGWAEQDVTILSLGTGISPNRVLAGKADRLWPWQWIAPGLQAMMTGTSAQQVMSAQMAFPDIEFIHLDAALKRNIAFNDVEAIKWLIGCGDSVWHEYQKQGRV